MESKWVLSCFFLVLMSFVYSSNCYTFHVGGKDGWVPNPSDDYNHWAERMRFQVNDTLYFKYKKGLDSVLAVTKDNYDSCNTTNPIKSFTDGHSIFKFDRPGPFFFISGNADNCKKNQKLIVVVMAARQKTDDPHYQAPPPSPYPDLPVSPPPAESPKSGPDSTPADPPTNGEVPPPSPAPSKSGSMGLVYSVGSVLRYSVGVSVVLGSLVGI